MKVTISFILGMITGSAIIGAVYLKKLIDTNKKIDEYLEEVK